MNRNARYMGITAYLAILLFSLAFSVLTSIFPPGEYNAANEFVLAFKPVLLIPVIPSFLLVLVNIPFFVSLYYFAEDAQRPFAMAGLLFGIAYAVCCGCNYFMQLSVVPQSIQLGRFTSLAVFSMHIRGSFAYSLVNLGYAFLSISYLFFSGIFNLKGFQGYIKAVFIIYGISGLLGTIGYIAGKPFLSSFVFISVFPYLVAVVLVMIHYFRITDSSEPD